MAKQITVTVQGKQINGAVISAYAKRVGSIDDVLSVWANAGTLQLVKHGNRNWLESLFNMPSLRLNSGDLSKAGKDVLAYIKAHCPLVIWNKDKKTFTYAKPATTNVFSHSFIAVGHTAPIEGEVTTFNGKYYKEHGDFSLTFTAFKDIVKEPKAPKDEEPSVKADAFNKALDKALATLKAGRFIGTQEELIDSYNKAKALLEQFDAIAKEAAEAAEAKRLKLATMETVAPVVEVAAIDMPLDLEAADKLHKTGQAGKSTRANGKVEPIAEAI